MSMPENNLPTPIEGEMTSEEANFDQTDFMDNSNFALVQETVLPAAPKGQVSLVTKYFQVTGVIGGVLILLVIILLVIRQKPVNEELVLTPIEQARVRANEEMQVVSDLAAQMFIPAESALIEGLVDL